MRKIIKLNKLSTLQIKKIKIGRKEEKNLLIEGVEKVYPGTKFAMAKSFENIFRK